MTAGRFAMVSVAHESNSLLGRVVRGGRHRVREAHQPLVRCDVEVVADLKTVDEKGRCARDAEVLDRDAVGVLDQAAEAPGDRKSTRLNSSHVKISYAVFCLKKKT